MPSPEDRLIKSPTRLTGADCWLFASTVLSASIASSTVSGSRDCCCLSGGVQGVQLLIRVHKGNGKFQSPNLNQCLSDFKRYSVLFRALRIIGKGFGSGGDGPLGKVPAAQVWGPAVGSPEPPQSQLQ